MIDVCIIGDSHIGAPKLALDQGKFASQDLRFSFWGTTGRWLDALDADQHRIFWNPRIGSPPTFSSPPRADIRYEDFDAFVFYGGRFRIERVNALLCRTRGYSKDFVHEGVASFVRKFSLIEVAATVARSSGRPVYVAPCPLQAREWLSLPTIRYRIRRSAWSCTADILEGLSITLIRQHPDTVRFSSYTKNKYSAGSRTLLHDADHSAGEKRHMNAEYGAVFLRQVEAHAHPVGAVHPGWRTAAAANAVSGWARSGATLSSARR